VACLIQSQIITIELVMHNTNLLFVAVALTFTLLACAGNNKLQERSPESVYRIQSGDLLEIHLEYYPDFNNVELVKPDGTLQFRALGRLPVVGMTEGELARMLHARYSKVLAMPKLTLSVQPSATLSFYLGGAIRQPGMLPFKQNLTIEQGIELAGGLKDDSENYEVVIFRNQVNGGVRLIKLRLYHKNWREQDDMLILPYDVVFVMKLYERKQNRIAI
jgi:protein involved in polysaccharide export with SLBB domain